MDDTVRRRIDKHGHHQTAPSDNENPQQDVHHLRLNQGSLHAASDPVPSARAVILGHVSGNGDSEGIIDQYGKLVHLGSRRISGYGVRSDGVHRRLHGQLTDTHHGHLETHGKSDPEMNGRFSPHTGKIILFQMKDRIFPGSGYRTQHCRNELGKNRRPRSAAHAHVERQDKNKIQHNIQKRGEHQKIQGRPAVSQRAENIGYHIIKYRRAGSCKNGKHIIISHSVNLFRGLHPVQDRMGQAAADASEDNGKHNAPHQRGGDTPAHAGFISGAAPLSQTDSESSGDTLDEAEYKIDDDTGGPHRGKGVRSQCFSDDHGICQRIKELKQISPDHRK